jgi:hypothetical protein
MVLMDIAQAGAVVDRDKAAAELVIGGGLAAGLFIILIDVDGSSAVNGLFDTLAVAIIDIRGGVAIFSNTNQTVFHVPKSKLDEH